MKMILGIALTLVSIASTSLLANDGPSDEQRATANEKFRLISHQSCEGSVFGQTFDRIGLSKLHFNYTKNRFQGIYECLNSENGMTKIYAFEISKDGETSEGWSYPLSYEAL